MDSNPDTQWTDERISNLKRLYAAGVSLENIRLEIGGEFTRSAISGKANRLGFVHAKSPILRRAQLRRARSRQKASSLKFGGFDVVRPVAKVSAPAASWI